MAGLGLGGLYGFVFANFSVEVGAEFFKAEGFCKGDTLVYFPGFYFIVESLRFFICAVFDHPKEAFIAAFVEYFAFRDDFVDFEMPMFGGWRAGKLLPCGEGFSRCV